jgi:hypothetical protein
VIIAESTITGQLDATFRTCVVSNGTSFGTLSRLKEEPMSLNRIVALLTPLVFAPLAGVISTWAAENLPGVNIPAADIEKIFIAGALIALAPAVQWLHGWQKWEARKDGELAVAAATLAAAPVVAEVSPPEEPELAEDLEEDFDDLSELDELDDFDEFEDTSVDEDEPVPVGS